MNPCSEDHIRQKVTQASYLWLFLDYDGTLADFAATPDVLLPDDELIDLIAHLAGTPDVRVTIISGRRLAHIRTLVPLPGILKAGSYGLEIETADGDTIYQVDYNTIRPLLDKLKKQWANLLDSRTGFYLEDKEWTLAIHAKDAVAVEAKDVLHNARRQAQALLDKDEDDMFCLLGGHRFLECGPEAASKRQTVEYLLATYPRPEDTLLVYLGDDDKDEVAFPVIQQQEGLAIAVGERLQGSSADCWLPSPQAVRRWLRQLLNDLRESNNG